VPSVLVHLLEKVGDAVVGGAVQQPRCLLDRHFGQYGGGMVQFRASQDADGLLLRQRGEDSRCFMDFERVQRSTRSAVVIAPRLSLVKKRAAWPPAGGSD
jgi:hypothetical protein